MKEKKSEEETKVISNIDLLNIGNPCNQNCRQCYQKEKGSIGSKVEKDIEKAEKIKAANKKSELFIYPKDITTSPKLLDLVSNFKQDQILTNANRLEPGFIDHMVNKGIKKIQITLFENEEEQNFWNGNSAEEYARIKENIRLCSEKGINTEIFTLITPFNLEKLPSLSYKVKDLGVKMINLVRILPVGNAKKVDERYRIKRPDLKELISVVDSLKGEEMPYIKYGPWFGPNFHGEKVWKFLRGEINEGWTSTKTLCPIIDKQYAAVSMKSNKVYWCFFLMSRDDAVAGYLKKNGEISMKNAPDFSKETLIENLDGICSKDNCEYQKYCLGGCRSFAYVYGGSIYAGMDMCRTEIKANKR